VNAAYWIKDRLHRWVDERADGAFLERLRQARPSGNEFGFDPFGSNPEEARAAWVAARWLHRHYFRSEVFGIEGVPDGRVLLVANHSGQLPWDGLCIVTAMLVDREPPRLVRAMTERWVPTLPFVSVLFARCGEVVGTPENCLRLLGDDQAILVFPEGVRGVSKPFSRRYELQDFGLGFMRLAMRARAPIVPVALIGAEEQAPAWNLRPVARALGWPAFPVSPLPPFLAVLPLPVRYRIHFGEPLTFDGDPDDDDDAIGRRVATVKGAIADLLGAGLRARRHVFW
jgi:1-acyl-sn-glycerol-3-phosphate acyltransferase